MNRFKIRSIYILFIFFSINGQCQTKQLIKYKGIYQTQSMIENRDSTIYYHYLRFYDNLKVISVSSIGDVNDVKEWFNIGMTDPSIGEFKINGRKIFFSLTSSYGTVIYRGRIKKNGCLILKTKSLINGHKGKQLYFFKEVAGLK